MSSLHNYKYTQRNATGGDTGEESGERPRPRRVEHEALRYKLVCVCSNAQAFAIGHHRHPAHPSCFWSAASRPCRSTRNASSSGRRTAESLGAHHTAQLRGGGVGARGTGGARSGAYVRDGGGAVVVRAQRARLQV